MLFGIFWKLVCEIAAFANFTTLAIFAFFIQEHFSGFANKGSLKTHI